jgi:uncharacterized LabA/DUF88 family protein
MSMVPSGGYFGPREVHYLFIDGGAVRGRLQNLSNRFFGGVAFNLDFKSIAGNYTKVFYYDALPVREDSETELEYETRIKSQKDVFDAASNVDRVHVYEGDARRRRKRGLEQKKVDVMLTVDMLTHAFRRNMHQATLLTGDNDFKPLIDALVQDGLFVTLWYPPDETSKELIQAADARRPLNVEVLGELLTTKSRAMFRIPTKGMMRPIEPKGRMLTQWNYNYATHCLYHTPPYFEVVMR